MISRIIILTEAGEKYGFGHFTRCLTIYRELLKITEMDIFFYVKGDDIVKEKFEEGNFYLLDWQNEEFINQKIHEKDYVLIDSYTADYNIYKIIAEKVKKTIYIDDFKRMDYPKGTVINPSLYAKQLNYKYDSLNEYISGEEYIILRKAFIQNYKNEIKEKIDKILITFGGSDPSNLTPFVLKKVIEKFSEAEKIVVIGKGYKNIEEIESVKDEKTVMINDADEETMLKLMLESDIAVSAGGQTIYEIINSRLPSIVLKAADNQELNIKTLSDLGCTIESSKENLDIQLNLIENIEIREKLYSRCSYIKMGEGAKNIAKEILKSLYYIRKAEKKDVDNIFKLSNEELVRENSINTEVIEYKEHLKWYDEKINDENVKFYIVYNDEESFLGQIRFEITGEEANISISFTEKLRGRHKGNLIMEMSIQELLKEKSNIKKINAIIKDKNKASIILFERYGFEMINEENGIKKYVKFI